MAENNIKKVLQPFLKALLIIAILYLFLLSIKLLGHSFNSFGRGFAETLISMTSNPFSGLIIGIVATSIIQSSSTTTSLVVGLVAGGALTIDTAIPMVMGANIGTTITGWILVLEVGKYGFGRFAGGNIIATGIQHNCLWDVRSNDSRHIPDAVSNLGTTKPAINHLQVGEVLRQIPHPDTR